MIRYPLHIKLILVFLTLSLFMTLVAGSLLFSNARYAIKNEIQTSQSIANKLVEESLKGLETSENIHASLQKLQQQFKHIRHVKIDIYDRQGQRVINAKTQSSNNKEKEAPLWFQALLKPDLQIKKMPINLGAENIGQIHFITNPLDEINEIWRDIFVLMKIVVFSLISLLLLIYLALGHALKPLEKISQGLLALKSEDYKFRLPPINSPELANIGRSFNDLAAELEHSRSEREKLSKQLLTLQDQERRNIALELHDEFGPCLFGIKTNASLIAKFTKEKATDKYQSIKHKAASILDIVDHMESCNRDLLSRLRPMALGEIALSELILKLISNFSVQYEKINWHIDLASDLPSFGETIDLTVYRIIQEALTNVVRHSRAKNVSIILKVAPLKDIIEQQSKQNSVPSSACLVVSIDDDGVGFSVNSKTNHGIKGLNERIETLGGKFSISGYKIKGTSIEVIIPLPADYDKSSVNNITAEERPDTIGSDAQIKAKVDNVSIA